MNSDTKTCPTCGQRIKPAGSNFTRALLGGFTGITFGILFGVWFSVWWFGSGMHSTPMSLIHYVAWGILFGFVGVVIGILIKR